MIRVRRFVVVAGLIQLALACGDVKSPQRVDGGADAASSVDGGSNFVDAAPSDDAMVDETPPDTTIASGPSDPSNSSEATFTFNSEGPGNPDAANDVFRCRLDPAAGGNFAACTSPHTTTGLTEGVHTFEVYAIDMAGNEDATPATLTWTVDLTAPTTTISSSPSDPTDQTSATFEFSADEAATFECSIDGGGFTACTSGVMFSGLAENTTHTFAVRATDAAGNTGSEATYEWLVDTSFPSVTITSGPSNPTNDPDASFTFSADPGVTLMCRLDGTDGACTSSTTMSYTGVGEGMHTFEVDATNALGKTSTATYNWTVDLTNPVLTILSGPANPTNQTAAMFTFSADEAVTFECVLDGTTGACDTTSSASYAGLAPGSHTFVVRGTDPAGNTGSATATWLIDVNPNLAVAPVSHDFGDQLVGTSTATRNFTFSNTGVGHASGCAAPSLAGLNAADFSIQTDGCGTNDLLAGATCTVSVDATPSVPGARTATLMRTCTLGGTVSTNANAIQVTGTQPDVVLSPLAWDFGNALVGASSAIRAFTFTNDGTAAATGCGVATLTGANSADFTIVGDTCAGNDLAAGGGTCVVSISARPSALGVRTATLSRACTIGGTVATGANALEVTGTEPDVTVSPTSHDFGDQLINTSTSARTFTFTNSGTAPATGCSAPVLLGANPADFTIQSDLCGTNDLAAGGGTCTLRVFGTPSALGLRRATLSRTCSIGGVVQTNTNGIRMTGTGVPSLSVTPLTHSFGPVAVGANSANRTFTFSNIGSAAATGCSAPTRSGSHPNDFVIVTDNCGTNNLAAGSSCTVVLRAKPTTLSHRTMTLRRSCTVGGIVSTTANRIEVNKPMYVFISSKSFDGNLGGLSGADQICQDLADAGSLTASMNKTWKALLSKTTGGTVHARDRFEWTGPMYDLEGLLVTANPSVWPWVSGGTSSEIGINENGGPPDDSYVWTGSTTSGTSQGAAYDCNNWSDNTGTYDGWSGETEAYPSSSWIDSFSNACDDNWFGLYCISQ